MAASYNLGCPHGQVLVQNLVLSPHVSTHLPLNTKVLLHLQECDTESKKEYRLNAGPEVHVDENAVGDLGHGNETQTVASVHVTFVKLFRGEEEHDIKLETMSC